MGTRRARRAAAGRKLTMRGGARPGHARNGGSEATRVGEQRTRTARKAHQALSFRKSRVSRKGALARPLSCLQLCAKRRFCETEPFPAKKRRA